jgi:hypothetical protein
MVTLYVVLGLFGVFVLCSLLVLLALVRVTKRLMEAFEKALATQAETAKQAMNRVLAVKDTTAFCAVQNSEERAKKHDRRINYVEL